MTKELESLSYVWYNYYTEELRQDDVEQIEKHLNVVQDGLKRLEAIDNANPSKAMEFVKILLEENKNSIEVSKANNYKTDWIEARRTQLLNLQQALLKAQEMEKVLEILKPLCEVVETPVRKDRYLKINGVVVYTFKSKEEFDTLKRWKDNGKRI